MASSWLPLCRFQLEGEDCGRMCAECDKSQSERDSSSQRFTGMGMELEGNGTEVSFVSGKKERKRERVGKEKSKEEEGELI